jgi:cilia- and flagella-associated protein 52
MGDSGAIELEHAIGYSAECMKSIYLHPNEVNYLYITGACIVVSDLNNQQGQTFLRGHDDSVTCLAISPSGNFVASGQKGYNADVLVWDFASKKVKFQFSEHDHEIRCLDFSHDDRLLCSCGSPADNKMFIWDCYTGYIVASVGLTPNPTISVKFGGYIKDIKGRPIEKYQLATCGNKKILMWSLNPYTGELENQVLNPGSAVREFQTLEFTPNGEKFFIAGTTSGDFLIFQMKNFHMFCMQPVCSKGVAGIIALNEENFVIGGGDGTLSIWTVQGAKSYEINRINLSGGISALAPSKDLSSIIVGTSLGFHYRVRSSDLANVVISESHTRPMTYVNFPVGVSDKFATSSEDGTIRIWDGSDYSVISRCVAPGVPTCFVLTLEIVISGWDDSKIRAFRADNGQSLWQVDNAHRGGVSALCLSNNMRFFATGGNDGEVRIWEIRTRDMVSHLKEHTSKVTDIKILRDDSYLVSVSRDRCMLTWDLKSEKRVGAQTQRIGGINCLSLAGEKVVTAGQERKLNLWDLRQTQPLSAIEAGPDPGSDEIYTLSVSNDGRFVATGGEKMILRIWDIAGFRIVAEGHGHSGHIVRISWAFDNKQVVSVGKDNCTLIWNIFID